MLGSMLVRRCRESASDISVTSITRETPGFDALSGSFSWLAQLPPCDLLVNCMAITRMNNPDNLLWQNALLINASFPHRLARAAGQQGISVVHISTDGIFKGRAEPYLETDEPDSDDIYGLTKTFGEVDAHNVLNIRTSIIGPEVSSRGHLMDWLLSHPDGSSVQGFTDHLWHGVTTLQMADLCLSILQRRVFESLRKSTSVLHFVPNMPISKFDLLKSINESFWRNIDIKPALSARPISRILASRFPYPDGSEPNSIDLRNALSNLASFVTQKKETAQ